MSLDPAVEEVLDDGDLVALDLIRIDVPGKTVGYHRGGRPFTYNGLVYKPNRYLDFGEANAALGVAVTTRTIVFSDIPTPDPDDAIAKLEEYEYTNAPVIVTHLAGRPNSNEVVGILYSTIYEIAEVRYLKGEQDADGRRSLTIEVDIEPPGRSARGATLVRRAQEEQQFDNDPDDTSLEYAALLEAETEEWGQAR